MLTPEQLQQVQSFKTTGGLASPTASYTDPEQAKAAFSATSATPTPTPTTNPRMATNPNVADTPANRIINSTASKTATDYSKAGSNFMDEAGKNDASTSKNAIVRTGENALGATASGLNTIFAPISNAIKSTVDETSNEKGIQNFSQNPVISKVLDFFSGKGDQLNAWAQAHPEAARNLSNAFTVGTAAIGEKPVTDVATKTLDSTKAGLDSTASTIKQGVDTATQIAKDTTGKIQQQVQQAVPDSSKLSDFYKKQSIADWKKPATIVKPGFSKATQIFKNAASKGNNIPETLVDNGLKLSDNIQDGKYATADAASQLRDDAGKLSNDLIRPSLETASYSTPKVPVSKIITNAKEAIMNDKSITPGDKITAVSKLNKEASALSEKYPDGMNLVEMHDDKITYSKNAGHNPIGTRSDNLTANTNNAISNSMMKAVEKYAPADVPVHEVNAELTKRYQAANYLQELNGKTVPKGLGAKIAQTTAKVAGAVAGESLGGGLLGGVGGYHLGGMIEKFIENASNPIKAHFLNNLQSTNPEAFAKIREYLGTKEMDRIMIKQLPSPTALGTDKNPHIMGPEKKTTYESPAQKINRERGSNQLALPKPGETSARTSLPKAGTGKAEYEKSLGINEVKNGRRVNPGDRRRIIR